MNLEITNCSRGDLILPARKDGAAGASQTNCHFALGFRPGTLADPEKITWAEESQTAWTLNVDQATDGTVWLYLLANKALTVAPTEQVAPVVSLENLEADGRAGSRGTRVLLRYQGLMLAGEPLAAGARQCHLTILSGNPSDLGRLIAGTKQTRQQLDDLEQRHDKKLGQADLIGANLIGAHLPSVDLTEVGIGVTDPQEPLSVDLTDACDDEPPIGWPEDGPPVPRCPEDEDEEVDR